MVIPSALQKFWRPVPGFSSLLPCPKPWLTWSSLHDDGRVAARIGLKQVKRAWKSGIVQFSVSYWSLISYWYRGHAIGSTDRAFGALGLGLSYLFSRNLSNLSALQDFGTKPSKSTEFGGVLNFSSNSQTPPNSEGESLASTFQLCLLVNKGPNETQSSNENIVRRV